jgi:hypothetical protein
MRTICLTFSFLAMAMMGIHAQLINITADGTPIDGTGNGDNSQTGNPGNQQGQTPPYNMTDASLSSSDQTFGSVSYAGLVGVGLQPVTTLLPVVQVQVNFALFYDGGWFGPNGQDSLDQEEQASGGTMQAPLTAQDLSVLPTMQITTDGSTWTDVSYTSNYASQLEGIYHYNEVISPIVTFTLDTPAADIEGIRLIGQSGGTSDFVGISNFAVLAPEPSTYALFGCGLLALLGLSRWRRLA